MSISIGSPFDASTFVLTSLVVISSVTTLLSVLQKRSKHVGRGSIFGAIAAITFLYQRTFISQMIFSGADIHRLECLYSDKGGKRPLGSTTKEYINPCFNSSAVNITDVIEIEDINTTNMHGFHDFSASMCPSQRLKTTTNNMGQGPFISVTRDCQKAQREECSISEPCTPCETSRFNEFHSSSKRWSRCRSCAPSNGYGDCSFVDGVGPYCWKDAISLDVVPCKICCSDGKAVFDEDGICY